MAKFCEMTTCELGGFCHRRIIALTRHPASAGDTPNFASSFWSNGIPREKTVCKFLFSLWRAIKAILELRSLNQTNDKPFITVIQARREWFLIG